MINVNPNPEPTPIQQSTQVTKDATSTSMAVSSNAELSKNTKVKSLNDLKDKAPEVYKKMMEGIATNIINKMKDAEERRRKILRDAGMA